jgi:hypothetical protein
MNMQSKGIADQLKASFPTVEKYPLSGPDGLKTPWYGLFRTDTAQPVGPGSVTAAYEPHTTDDVIALVEAAESTFGDIVAVKSGFRDGHHVVVEPELNRAQRLQFYENDVSFPRLFIDGTYGRRFRASIGLHRIVCSNLYTMNRVAGVSVDFRHSSGLRPRMDELIQTFGTLRDGWAALSAHLQRLEGIKVNVADFLDAMYGQPDEENQRSVTLHKNRTEAIITRLARERMAAGRPMGSLHEATGWEAFNFIQGYVQHEKTRRQKNVGEFDRVILANADPVVTKAEGLLLSMAV